MVVFSWWLAKWFWQFVQFLSLMASWFNAVWKSVYWFFVSKNIDICFRFWSQTVECDPQLMQVLSKIVLNVNNACVGVGRISMMSNINKKQSSCWLRLYWSCVVVKNIANHYFEVISLLNSISCKHVPIVSKKCLDYGFIYVYFN